MSFLTFSQTLQVKLKLSLVVLSLVALHIKRTWKARKQKQDAPSLPSPPSSPPLLCNLPPTGKATHALTPDGYRRCTVEGLEGGLEAIGLRCHQRHRHSKPTKSAALTEITTMAGVDKNFHGSRSPEQNGQYPDKYKQEMSNQVSSGRRDICCR